MSCLNKKCSICFENKYPKITCNTINCPAVICSDCNKLLTDTRCPLCRQNNVLLNRTCKYIYIFMMILFSILIFGFLMLYSTKYHTFGLPVNYESYFFLLMFYGITSLVFLLISLKIFTCVLLMFEQQQEVVYPEEENVDNNDIELTIDN